MKMSQITKLPSNCVFSNFDFYIFCPIFYGDFDTKIEYFFVNYRNLEITFQYMLTRMKDMHGITVFDKVYPNGQNGLNSIFYYVFFGFFFSFFYVFQPFYRYTLLHTAGKKYSAPFFFCTKFDLNDFLNGELHIILKPRNIKISGHIRGAKYFI